MSTLDKIMQDQQYSEMLASLMSRLDAVEAQERELTKANNAMSGFIKVMDEAHTAAFKRLEGLISQLHEQRSQTQLDDETKNRLNEIEMTLAAVAKQLSDKRVVKLSDGSSVSASDLQAHSMMKQINEKMTTMTSAFESQKESNEKRFKWLIQAVKAKSTVQVDADKVAELVAQQVTDHFDQAVQKPVEGLRSDLEGFREDMSTLGAERLSEVRTDLQGLLSEMRGVEETAKRYERQVNFVSVSRIALALIPLSVALILVGGLVWGVGSMFGIGPLFGWAWGAFTAASLWWQKALIAAATLGGAALFIWVVLRVSRWVYEELR
jgi:hypothetical protein